MSLPHIALYPIQPATPVSYPNHVIDTNTAPENVQFYVTFDGKTYPAQQPPPIKHVLDVGKIYSKTPSPAVDALAAPDLISMTEIWEREFRIIFASFLPHCWYLLKTFQSPSPRWRRFKDSAKVRFCCQGCGHAWTSMKGRVMFWFHLSQEQPYPEGFLQYKLYGQQCNQCQNGRFEDAMWYPEEVNKVLCNVYNKIGQVYYGFMASPLRQERRAGKPRTQHNSALCQACMDGECFRAPKIEEVAGAQKRPTVTTVSTSTSTVTARPVQQRILLPVHQPIVNLKSTTMRPLSSY